MPVVVVLVVVGGPGVPEACQHLVVDFVAVVFVVVAAVAAVAVAFVVVAAVAAVSGGCCSDLVLVLRVDLVVRAVPVVRVGVRAELVVRVHAELVVRVVVRAELVVRVVVHAELVVRERMLVDS